MATDVTQAHIHFGQRGVNGGVSVFFCSNLGNGPAGTQALPPRTAGRSPEPGSRPTSSGPAGQGIAPGEFDELLAAIRAGATYVNIHTVQFRGGEVRSQIEPGKTVAEHH